MSGSSTEKTSTSSAPWQVQTPFLTDAFVKARNLNNTQYSGDRVAQFTPDQLATFQKMVGAGGGTAGQDALSGGSTLLNTGVGGIQGALSRLGAFSPAGGTQGNIAAASAYADAAANPAAVDAVMRDARRQVSEQALPQVARDAAMSGNALSSKRAISEGIIERGLAEKGADVSAGMRQDAFKTGLGLSEQGRQFDNSSILDAMKAQGSVGVGSSTAGLGGIGTGVDATRGLFDLAAAGGAGQRDATQAGLDNAIAIKQSPWDDLMKYYGIVGGNNWGGTSTGESTKTKTPSAWEIIGGLSAAAGSFMKSDRRAKTDIRIVGAARNGLPIYKFRYRDDPTLQVHVGLMAQDVEAVNPEAVKTIDGVKHVNYDLALAD